ncbi:MAG: uL15 family ribosomal protein [Patescibacteria group bacterium]
MQLHNLNVRKPKRAQRIGRSGKRGSYSGRGIKGQKSRSGRRIRPAERDLILRLPKRRGFKNRPTSREVFELNLSDITPFRGRLQGFGFKINPDILREVRLVPPRFRGAVKILAGGEINFPVQIENVRVSQSAKGKIEKAGGKINQ